MYKFEIIKVEIEDSVIYYFFLGGMVSNRIFVKVDGKYIFMFLKKYIFVKVR